MSRPYFWSYWERTGCMEVYCGGAVHRTRGALRLGKRDRWYRRVNVQPQNPAYSGFLHKASILPWHTQPPSSSCKQMHGPPQLLAQLYFSGNSDLLPACPFMLWHNVACSSWPPLERLDILSTVSSLCMWCNMVVFSGSTAGGERVQSIVLFPSPLLLFLFGWVTHQKSPCARFSSHPRSGQYESSPQDRRTKGHTCDTLRPFGIWVRSVSWSSKPGFQ